MLQQIPPRLDQEVGEGAAVSAQWSLSFVKAAAAAEEEDDDDEEEGNKLLYPSSLMMQAESRIDHLADSKWNS